MENQIAPVIYLFSVPTLRTCSILTFFPLCLLSFCTFRFPRILFPFKNLDQFILISPCLSKSSSFHLHSFPCLSLSTSIPPPLRPVEGQWLEWGPWSRCSVTCNTGTQQRQRRCSASVHGWAECKGPHEESRECTNPSCSGKTHKWIISIHTHVLPNAIMQAWHMHYRKASVWSSLIRVPHISNLWVWTQFGLRVCFPRRTNILVCFNEPGPRNGLVLTYHTKKLKSLETAGLEL